MIRGSFLLSGLVNIYHWWEYQTVEGFEISDLFKHTDVYNQINGFSYSDYPEANQDTPYFAYSIIYFIINFGGFFLLNTGIEIKIVRRMHIELKEKRERIAKMNATNSSVSNSVRAIKVASSSETLNENKKREAEDAKKERRVIKMVILNGILNFILRAPDMLFWLENKMTWAIFNYSEHSCYRIFEQQRAGFI
jgi:hypothetical protein